MLPRSPLRKQLYEAWKKAIRQDYCSQRINSERSLQASFWAQLNKALPSGRRRMFIEPCVTRGKSHPRHFPDIVICNTVRVIAVIEIKYMPRGLPSSDRDVDKLRYIAKHREHLHVSNVRFRGPASDAKVYKFSKDVLFVWAAVHKTPRDSYESPEVSMLSQGIKELERCFLQLHAETSEDAKPRVFARPKVK